MKFRADEITSVIQREIEQFQSEVTRTEVGRVLEVGDGIARVHGLSGVMTGEMVTFENGVKGLAFNLEESSVGVIILGDYTQIHEGETVTATGELLRVPVGEAMVGRVVNPLGEPIDNKGPIVTRDPRWSSRPPPGSPTASRSTSRCRPAIKAIDAMTPIGRGQRELIIGDRKTGKTAIAIDAILNQKGDRRHLRLRRDRPEGVDDRQPRRRSSASTARWTTPSSSPPAPATRPRSSTSPPTPAARWPSTSCTRRGWPTLCVYDDLSKQAVAYRELSLLLRRPPGREAYPGDVFYAHSRLLERSAKLANKYVIVPDGAPTDTETSPSDSGVNGKVYLGVPGLEEAKHELKEHYPAGPQGRQDDHLGRLADGPAADRDARRRGLGLHPDQRDLDHRRPDLPPARPLLRGRPAGGRRRHQRLARGRQGPDPGDEEGGRRPPARPRRLPRAGGVRPARHRARQGHPAPARPRLPDGRAAQAAAVPADGTWSTRS